MSVRGKPWSGEIVGGKERVGSDGCRVFVVSSHAGFEELVKLRAFDVVLLDHLEYGAEYSTVELLGCSFGASALLKRSFTLRPTSDVHYVDAQLVQTANPTRVVFNIRGYSKAGHQYFKIKSEAKLFPIGYDFHKRRETMKLKAQKMYTEDHLFPFRPLPGGNPSLGFFSSLPSSLSPFTVQALISHQRGLKEHPLWTGSGDHVNSMMQLDLYQQFSYLVAEQLGLWKGAPLDLLLVASPLNQFVHYVEFGGVLDFILGEYKMVAGDLESFDDVAVGGPCKEWSFRELLYLEVECKQFGQLCSICHYYIGNLKENHKANL